MKLNRNATWPVVLILIALPFAYAGYLYPSLNDRIPTHFNAAGEADAWGSKDNIFLLPTILGATSLLVYLLLANIKKIDPKRASGIGTETIKGLGVFTVASMSFMSLVVEYGIAHEGTPIDKLLFGALGVLFAGMGYFMPKLKQNYFAGYKLAWTLDNETNWNRTHQLAGKLWITGGLLQIVFAILLQGTTLFIVFMTTMAIISIVPGIYSYLLFKKGNPAA